MAARPLHARPLHARRMDAHPPVCDTAPMSATANALLLLAAAANFAAGYRLGWACVPDLATLPPNVAAPVLRARRIYYLSMAMAFLSCAAMLAHLALNGIVDSGPLVSQGAVATALPLLAIALWCLASSRRPA